PNGEQQTGTTTEQNDRSTKPQTEQAAQTPTGPLVKPRTEPNRDRRDGNEASSQWSRKGTGDGATATKKSKEKATGGTAAPEPSRPPQQLPSTPDPSTLLDLSPVPSVTCTDAPGAPRGLLPIYKAASDRYGLGPKGPGILASINLIETRFGELNHVTSYAGAQGWMQFMPGTWAAYGVDADGDGKADPYNPKDAIFSAANYLSASGAPGDWYKAIYAYNHAHWYVAEVLAKAGCYGQIDGGVFSLVPKMPALECEPARPKRLRIPPVYLTAFEEAAGRYALG